MSEFDKSNVEFDSGRYHRANLGFIVLSGDLACEHDLFNMTPEGVGISFTRLKTDDYTTNETLAAHVNQLAEAASRIQPDIKPDVISYCCTSGSIVIGEEEVKRQIAIGAPYTKPMSLVTGVVSALNAVQAKKIVIGTPYLDEINAREEEFFLSKGFEILRMEGLNLETGIEFGKVTPDFWNKFSLEIDCEDADAVFLSCTGIRSLDILEKVEAQINKPVITSNQAQMWSALRLAGINDNLKGYGQLFGY
jgi:maleate isomerase